MFTNNDIAGIDRSYFEVLSSSPFALTLRSKPTSHEWHLVMKSVNDGRSCEVYHRHKQSHSWHPQWGSKHFPEVLDAIKEHDRFQLGGRINYGDKA